MFKTPYLVSLAEVPAAVKTQLGSMIAGGIYGHSKKTMFTLSTNMVVSRKILCLHYVLVIS
jgi:hypothetical protein